MRARDILSKEETNRYHESWRSFEGKNQQEEKFNVHSSKPVVSKIFVFAETPQVISRAKVLQKKLREFDPYFVTNKYANPIWHMQHYIMVTEQMYHATTNLVKDNSKHVVKDSLENTRMRIPIFWDNEHKHISVELVLMKRENSTRNVLYSEDAYFTLYNDTNNFPLSSMHFRTYANYRAYIRDLNILNNGASEEMKAEALESLIRKVEMQNVKHNQWAVDRRKSLKTTEDQILEAIKSGDISEAQLSDFFSLWDSKESLSIPPN